MLTLYILYIKWYTLQFKDLVLPRGATMPFLRGGEMSWVWVDHRVKRSEQGGECRGVGPPFIRFFFEFALKIVVFDRTNFPILSKWIEFLCFLINKLNYLVFDLHCIDNNLQIKFFFWKQISNSSFFGIMYTIFVAKSRFKDQSHFLHFWVVLLPVIEVMKNVVANILEIMQK